MLILVYKSFVYKCQELKFLSTSGIEIPDGLEDNIFSASKTKGFLSLN